MDNHSDYNNLIDMKQEQLENVILDHENDMKRIKDEIVECYELAQPHLLKMRVLKQQLKKIEEKLEAAKTFLSLEKNGSLVSTIELINEVTSEQSKLVHSLSAQLPIATEYKPIPKTTVVKKDLPKREQDLPKREQDLPKREQDLPKREQERKFTSPLVSNWMKGKSNTLRLNKTNK